MTTPSPSSDLQDPIAFHVVLRSKRGRKYIYSVEGFRAMSGHELVERLARLYKKEAQRWNLGLQNPVVHIGTLPHWVSLVVAQEYPYELTITSSFRSPELTAAFYRPQLLRTCRPFASEANWDHILVGSHGRKAIVVDHEINKTAVALLVVSTLMLTVAAGIAVGVSVKRAELGIAVSAGMFTIVSALEVLLFWLVK